MKERERDVGNVNSEEQKTALEEARSCIERLVTEYNKVQADRDVTQQEAVRVTSISEMSRTFYKSY